MKQLLCFISVFAMLFSAYASAVRTVYAGQGGICVFEENEKLGLMDIFGENPGQWKIEPSYESYARFGKSGEYLTVSADEGVLGSDLCEINPEGRQLTPLRDSLR